jgi:hypothetical protein
MRTQHTAKTPNEKMKNETSPQDERRISPPVWVVLLTAILVAIVIAVSPLREILVPDVRMMDPPAVPETPDELRDLDPMELPPQEVREHIETQQKQRMYEPRPVDPKVDTAQEKAEEQARPADG